jgi:hypothetical protein
MNKKLGSSWIYLTKEQYSQVKISKSFNIHSLILVVKWRTTSIFVQVVIPWFRHHREVYLEFCKYWSSPEFKEKSVKKRMNRENDLKHRYGADGHIRKSQRMVRFHGPSAIYMNIIMRLTLNYRPSGMVLWGVTFMSFQTTTEDPILQTQINTAHSRPQMLWWVVTISRCFASLFSL